jgi:uncharacterized protein YqjF (DUF2071 family)
VSPAPARRPAPARPWRWAQNWQDLLFAHWRVPAGPLARHLPAGCEPDTLAGDAWVTAVAFRLTGLRPRWLPPFGPFSAFPELNLRTYVRHGDGPAVVFLSIHAGRRSTAALARLLTPLPYGYGRLDYRRDGEAHRFRCRARGSDVDLFAAEFFPTGRALPTAPGSADEWLLERYCMVAAGRRGLVRAVVGHERWQVQPAEVTVTASALGGPFGLDLARPPDEAHFAPGVRARVWPFEPAARPAAVSVAGSPDRSDPPAVT